MWSQPAFPKKSCYTGKVLTYTAYWCYSCYEQYDHEDLPHEADDLEVRFDEEVAVRQFVACGANTCKDEKDDNDDERESTNAASGASSEAEKHASATTFLASCKNRQTLSLHYPCQRQCMQAAAAAAHHQQQQLINKSRQTLMLQ
jgi:hypothetical protein